MSYTPTIVPVSPLQASYVDMTSLRLALFRNGYRPVPISKPTLDIKDAGKRPTMTGWVACCAEPETAKAEILGWATTQPECTNTGILCAGLRAVDLDIDDPAIVAQIHKWLRDRFGEFSWRFRADSARILVPYRADKGEPGKRTLSGAKRDNGEKGYKIEILGAGEQFVAFGLHPSGATLEWVGGNPTEILRDDLPTITEADIDALFAFAAPLINAQGESQGGGGGRGCASAGLVAESIDDAIAALRAIPNDGPADWNAWKRRAMMFYAATDGAEESRDVWHEWSRRHPDYSVDITDQCWREIRRSRPTQTGAEVLFAEARQHGWQRPAPSWALEVKPAEPEQVAQPEQQPTATKHAAKRYRSFTLPEFQRRDLPPQEMFLSPWLPKGGLTMLYAPRGIGKTFVAMNVAYAVATGKPFLRWNAPEPRRVLYLDGEMASCDLVDRFRGIIAAGGGVEPNNLTILPMMDVEQTGGINLADPNDQRDLQPHVDQTDLIIVDNISCLTRGAENKDEDWAPVSAWALAQRRAGRSVLFVHHAGKAGTQRGTSKREDPLNSVLTLRRPADYSADQGACFVVEYEKARGFLGSDARPFEAALSPLGWVCRDVGNERMAEVLALHAEGMSQRDIAKATGVARSTVGTWIRKAPVQEPHDGGAVLA